MSRPLTTFLVGLFCGACAEGEALHHLAATGGALNDASPGGTGGVGSGGAPTGGAANTGGAAVIGSGGGAPQADSGNLPTGCSACGPTETCVGSICVPGTTDTTPFAYPPSHFDPSDPALSPGGAATLDCGVTTFDSESLAFGNWCGGAAPVPVVVAQPNGPEIVVVPVGTFTVAAGATLALTGNRPVVLAVYGDAVIAGTIDASASGTSPGAGGNLTCGASTGTDATGSSSAGGGGGGGGGHATTGASGGSGDGATPGTGGGERGTPDLAVLMGGCPGGLGGGCSEPGGGGGGAVQLSVSGSLQIAGSIAANGGEGSAGCGSEGGGAGGGSGGAILLEATTVTLDGSGRLDTSGGRGGDGSGGGGGGLGGGTATPETGQSDDANGGGGGGGAAGRIRVNATAGCTLSGTSIPAAAQAC